MKLLANLIKIICVCYCPCLFINTGFAQNLPHWGATFAKPFETPVDSLRHGDWTWNESIAPKGPILVVVSLDEQKAYTYRNGLLIGVADVSSGKAGHSTPTGVFTTLLKDVDHHSSKYNNASMPYTQKLTSDGISLHAGGLPGYPSSHGCVHLPSEYAKLLFKASPLGMMVVIATRTTQPASVNHPGFLSPVTIRGKSGMQDVLPANTEYRWNPELSSAGPISVIISRADQRAIVMRNGVEIGRSKIQIDNMADSIGTHVLVASEIDSTATSLATKNDQTMRMWVGLSFQSTQYENDKFENPLADHRIHIPQAFMRRVMPLVTAGTSVVITDAKVLRTTTGVPLSILSSSPEFVLNDSKSK